MTPNVEKAHVNGINREIDPSAASDLSNTSTKNESKPRSSVSVAAKIGALVCFCIAAIIGVAGTGIWQMHKIGVEIVAIAENDIPLTDIVSKITLHQTEQAVYFERAVRFGAEISHTGSATGSAREHFKHSVGEFEAISKVIAQEFKTGKALVVKAVASAHTELETTEFKHVAASLIQIQEHHAASEQHIAEVFENLRAGNTASALNLVEQIEAEEDKLHKELEGLLNNIQTFTEAAAKQAEADEKLGLQLIIIVSIVSLLLASVAAWLVVTRQIARPLSAVVDALKALTAGDTDIEIKPYARDEIGEVADALSIFRDAIDANKELERANIQAEKEAAAERERKAEEKMKVDQELAKQSREEARLSAEKAELLAKITSEFDAQVNAVLASFASAAEEMQSSAQSLSATAEQTSQKATTVAAASEEASSNVQTVATAAEEMSASIGEISRQIDESARIAREGVQDAEVANGRVQGLAEAAQKIGDVVNLINDIASQTNLLALNATIEAARAGEAGKGFAVVATEVKSLADQTAKATEEIESQIAEIQGATNHAVQAIEGIGSTISKVDGIATAIATAMEQQRAATGEIAGSVQNAATGTQEVSTHIADVTIGASETGSAATSVLDATTEMNAQAAVLRRSVDEFLEKVKVAA